MTGHDDRTAANGNADRHARATHRHRVRDGRRAGAACGCVRSGPSLRAVLPRSVPVLNRTAHAPTRPSVRRGAHSMGHAVCPYKDERRGAIWSHKCPN